MLVDGIVEAIRESRALKIYVCNVMTQEGETEGYTASDHIRALFNHSCPGLFDLCLVNDAPIPPSVMRGYTREGAEPILCDRDACEALGVEVITRPVSTVENGLATVPRCHCASISYGDTMEITFAGTQAETDTERDFFRFLVRAGIPVRVESNR